MDNVELTRSPISDLAHQFRQFEGFMEPELVSCGFLIVRGDPIQEFLLMKHPQRWDLPKGHVDPGETKLQCALRELNEETGILPDQIRVDDNFVFVHEYLVQYQRTGGVQRRKQLVVYLGHLLTDVNIQCTEHDDFAWFPWQPPHDIQQQTINPLLSALHTHLEQHS